MIVAVALIIIVTALTLVGFFGGFVLGCDVGLDATERARLQSADAERQLWDATRQAFVAMAEASEEADAQRRPDIATLHDRIRRELP